MLVTVRQIILNTRFFFYFNFFWRGIAARGRRLRLPIVCGAVVVLGQYEIREIETLSPCETTAEKTQHHQQLLKALSFDFIYINKSRKADDRPTDDRSGERHQGIQGPELQPTLLTGLKRIFLSLHARAHKSKANLFITESDQLKR